MNIVNLTDIKGFFDYFKSTLQIDYLCIKLTSTLALYEFVN